MATASSGNGIGFLGLLGITFIVLKLLDVITWSWWWVLLPIYGGAVVALLAIVMLLFYLSAHERRLK